jgi:hypothetical protein
MALVDDRVIVAAINNAHWCDIVCRSHGLPTIFSAQLWTAPNGSPRLYPDAVTLAPGLPVDSVLGHIDAAPCCSVKDSFADLELSAQGFTVLSEAHWLYHEPALPRGLRQRGWQAVTTDDELERWVAAAALSGIIRSDILRDPSVRVLAVQDSDVVSAGAIINRTGRTAGLSNVFATSTAPALGWRDLPAAIADRFPGAPIVGYEHGSALEAGVDSGFEAIGPYASG